MLPNYSLFGLNFPELVFFGILIYIVALISVICLAHFVRSRIFCPSSRRFLHCEYVDPKCSCDICPRCALRQKAINVFRCNRRHSVYDQSEEVFPACRFGCFKPDCRYLRCVCCEFYVENELAVFSIQR